MCLVDVLLHALNMFFPWRYLCKISCCQQLTVYLQFIAIHFKKCLNLHTIKYIILIWKTICRFNWYMYWIVMANSVKFFTYFYINYLWVIAIFCKIFDVLHERWLASHSLNFIFKNSRAIKLFLYYLLSHPGGG